MRALLSIHHELDRDSGAPGVTVRLGEALRSLGHEVDFLSFDDMPGTEKAKRYRFPYFVAREIRRRPAYEVLDLSSGDGWFHARTRGLMAAGGKSLLVARSHGLEHVQHEAYLAEAGAGGRKLSWKYPLYNGGFRLWECGQSFAHADLSLFLNKADLNYATTKLHVRPERARLVRNGVSAEFLEQARLLGQQPSDAPSALNIAFVGTFIERKGVDLLCSAATAIMRRNGSVRLGCFGTGAAADTVLSAFPPELRGRVTVVPRYRNAELPELLRPFHILAAPSRSEGFGLAFMEAMACGLVPVVSDIPGPTEFVVDGSNGLIAPVGDASALQSRIERLIGQPSLWAQLRSRAISTAIGHSWTAVAEETVAQYKRAAAMLGLGFARH